MIVAKKIAVLALVVAAIGLPINDLTDYAILLAAAVVVLVGSVKPLPSRWLAAVALAIAVAAGHVLLPAPRIDEGHNVFWPGPDAARTSGLPRAVFDLLDRQFAEQYPPEKRCDDQSRGCWRTDRSECRRTASAFPPTASSTMATTRAASPASISPIPSMRGSASSTSTIYNWSPNASDIERFSRDERSLNLFDRYHLTFPLYVMYRFPADFVGSSAVLARRRAVGRRASGSRS